MRARRTLFVVGALLLTASALPGQETPPRDEKPQEKPEEKPRRERVVTDLSGFDLLDTTRVKKQTMVEGATRGDAAPLPLAPRLGKAYAIHPVFAWGYEGSARAFVFTLWNDAQEEIYRAEVRGTHVRYPSNAPPLEPGKAYFWTVEASVPLLGSGGPSAPVGVLMVAPSQREAMKRELASLQDRDAFHMALSRARAFTRHRIWYDAVAEYTNLIAQHPTRPELYEERGMIYAQLEATRELAEADWARADDLEGR